MRLRNPVEYLSNPARRVVPADELFSNVLRGLRRLSRSVGVFLWQKNGKWVAQTGAVGTGGDYVDRGPVTRECSTVSEALTTLVAGWVPKVYDGDLVIAAEEEADIAALLQLILTSLPADMDTVRRSVASKKTAPRYYRVLVTHNPIKSQFSPLDLEHFYVRPHLTVPEYSPYGNQELYVRPDGIWATAEEGPPPFVGTTVEEALTAAAAAFYGAGR